MFSVEPEVQRFVDSIGAKLPSLWDKEFALFDHVTKRGNYFCHPAGFMIVKISRTEVPFWGVGKKHIDILNGMLEDYFLVLLVSDCSGYVLNKQQINSNIEHDEWRVSGPDYKVHRPPMRYSFNTVEECSRLVTPRTPSSKSIGSTQKTVRRSSKISQ